MDPRSLEKVRLFSSVSFTDTFPGEVVPHSGCHFSLMTHVTNGFPSPITAAKRITSEGPMLNISKLLRTDAGIYTCEAVNTQGSVRINITVIVECKCAGADDQELHSLTHLLPLLFSPLPFHPPADGTTIVNVSENTVVGPGEDVTLSCSVEGKPLTEEHVRWERDDYDMAERTEATFANGTAFLHIRNAQREDVGNFRCIADNRVANPTSRDVLLIVKCKCTETESAFHSYPR